MFKGERKSQICSFRVDGEIREVILEGPNVTLAELLRTSST